jgi:hypothetical protein
MENPLLCQLTLHPLDHNNTNVKNPHITAEAFLKMAGVTILERPTRADFRYGESAALSINATPLDHNNTDVKKPHITVEAFLKMAEVTRFERPTRADFRNGESAALPITTTPNLLQ